MRAMLSRGPVAVALIAIVALTMTAPANAAGEKGRYIVVLENSVEHPGELAQALTKPRDGSVRSVYRHALKGYSATLPDSAVDALRRNPRVRYVTPDHEVTMLEAEVGLETIKNGGAEIFSATVPTGIKRVFAPSNKTLGIDGVDNSRANVDVAVLDTGIDNAHPDLDVQGRTICTTGTCVANSGIDGNGHGTHVAGTVGAIDNGEGVVGLAPGARMWAVKVLDNAGFGPESSIIAGVDWVTAHAGEIEVANMSLGCACAMPALDTAINKSVEAGVVYVVAAGNSSADAKNFSPASNPNVITVSALADYDGEPGGKSAYTCESYGLDDRSATFSNYGSTVDVAAPGVCILSTVPGGEYAYLSGTSMASPHVAGAAAILASQKNPANKSDVEAIRSTIVSAGNLEWTDSSGDGVKEKLLDVKNETTFKLATVPPPGPPKNTSLPVISPAAPFENVSAATTDGSWTEKPTSFQYQWKLCNSSGAECAAIGGATSAAYKPVAADVGKTLRVDVTAKNSTGEATAISNATNPVKAAGEVTTYQPAGEIKPTGVTAGPDGNMWYTNWNDKIGKITTAGSVLAEYSLPAGSKPLSIVPGPDGKLWFTNRSSSKIGKITTSGTVTEYALPASSEPYGITSGPDGNVWFTNAASSKIGKITTAGTITEYALPSGSSPGDITTGPDGKLWFAVKQKDKIGKITTAGTITEYSLPAGSNPYTIASGPDGNLWSALTGTDKIAKITTAGTITEYAIPGGAGAMYGMTTAADGNLWVSSSSGTSSKVIRVTTGGSITSFALPTTPYPTGIYPEDIAVGPDSRLWMPSYVAGKLAAMVP